MNADQLYGAPEDFFQELLRRGRPALPPGALPPGQAMPPMGSVRLGENPNPALGRRDGIATAANPDAGIPAPVLGRQPQPPVTLGARPTPALAPSVAAPAAQTEYENLRSHPPEYHGAARFFDTLANVFPLGR